MRRSDGMEDEAWSRQRARWAKYRAKRGLKPVVRIPRALWGEAAEPRVAEAPFPRGFALDRGAFSLAHLAFWGRSP